MPSWRLNSLLFDSGAHENLLIWFGARHSGSNKAGEHTKMLKHFAREVATLSRFNEWRKFIPRGASACVEVVME